MSKEDLPKLLDCSVEEYLLSLPYEKINLAIRATVEKDSKDTPFIHWYPIEKSMQVEAQKRECEVVVDVNHDEEGLNGIGLRSIIFKELF